MNDAMTASLSFGGNMNYIKRDGVGRHCRKLGVTASSVGTGRRDGLAGRGRHADRAGPRLIGSGGIRQHKGLN
jgi:hypothetical protein